jgi:hypothetical protein
MNQSLFKDEYDLSAMLTIQAPKTSMYNWIKIDAGLFSGSVENTSNMDYKRIKDFIGRLNVTKSFMDENLKISGDLSYYRGKVPNGNTTLYKIQSINGVSAFTPKTVLPLDNELREYYGADAQASFTSSLGLTTLRGEFTKGQQVSAAGAIINPTVLTNGVYVRKVQGYYLMFVQNIGQSRHYIVVKYDTFDPNTQVSGNEINGDGTGATAGRFTPYDVKYSDLGLGYICRIDANMKLTLYYDFNSNETTAMKGYTYDLKDNVLTVRLQYKF